MITVIVLVFLIGYLMIIFEEKLAHDKSSIALTLGGSLWILLARFYQDHHFVNHQLLHHMEEIAGIIFFLMGAMTIVELIDLNGGFNVIIERIKFKEKKSIIFVICLLTFFLSAALDNLTTAIVMSSMSRKIFKERLDRLFSAGLIIIAANAGGAWSPLGDVTTTMLWISNRISADKVILNLFIPSIISLLIPLAMLIRNFKGNIETIQIDKTNDKKSRNFMFFSGIFLLLIVPVLKIITGLPPFLAMIFAVGVYWMISEIVDINKSPEQKESTSIYKALEKLDIPSLLFFLGILLAVSALQSAGILSNIANLAEKYIPNQNIFSILIGIMSSIFDNVPILAAIQGMYSTEVYPQDHSFWHLLAFCVGTGGSMLVIGSAAGVAIMNSEKIEFMWYLKKITLPALLGFLGGAAIFTIFFT